MGTKITEDKKKWFNKIKNSNVLYSKDKLVLEICKDKNVLDIGCVGQDIDYNSEEWMHNLVKKEATSIVGVDINKDGIKTLKSKGYDVYHYLELNKLDKKFDILLMLDVIEHVNNPIEFINDYKKFLKEDGKIIITTPNSNRAINFINIFFRNEYPLNYEHTFWFCPKTFMEVLERVQDINVYKFYWLNHYTYPNNPNWKTKIIYKIDNFLVKFRSHFSPNFMFILELKK